MCRAIFCSSFWKLVRCFDCNSLEYNLSNVTTLRVKTNSYNPGAIIEALQQIIFLLFVYFCLFVSLAVKSSKLGPSGVFDSTEEGSKGSDPGSVPSNKRRRNRQRSEESKRRRLERRIRKLEIKKNLKSPDRCVAFPEEAEKWFLSILLWKFW